MKDITLIVLKDALVNEATYSKSGDYDSPSRSLPLQLESMGISFDVIQCEVENIPNKINSKAVVFLDHSFLVKDDYIFNAITINNLFRDMGIMFGPVEVKTSSNKHIRHIKNSYHSYSLDFGGGTQVSDITSEEHNYGTLRSAVISGPAYNRIGFSSLQTPRSCILDNPLFIRNIAKNYKIYYCSNLSRLKSLSERDFSIDVLSDYYYDIGFRDGLSNADLAHADKRTELWRKFVESPEVVDSSNPRWLFDQTKDEETIEYLELLVMLRCKYQIGYFEGMLGKKLI